MTNRKSGFTVKDGQRVFSVDPADFAWRISEDWLPLAYSGHSVLEHPFLPYIEREAVSRLSKEADVTKQSPPLLTDGYDDWRLWWLRVAHAYITESCAGLSPVAAAAARILVSAARMRAAVDKRDAQVSALLGMQIICEAIAAGYALTVELDAKELAEQPRKTAFANGAGKRADDYTELRRQMIVFAAKRFAELPCPLIGKVAEELWTIINKPETKEKTPDFWDLPNKDTIRDWLKDAAKEGKLCIPPAARKAGRPKSKAN